MTDDRDPSDLGLSAPHECDGGWLDRDAARPCLICRPWLAGRGSPPPFPPPRRHGKQVPEPPAHTLKPHPRAHRVARGKRRL